MDRTRPSVASASQQLVIAFIVGPWIRIRNWIAIYPTKPPPIMNNLQLMIYKSSARRKKKRHCQRQIYMMEQESWPKKVDTGNASKPNLTIRFCKAEDPVKIKCSCQQFW
jgi:hypothetical protein